MRSIATRSSESVPSQAAEEPAVFAALRASHEERAETHPALIARGLTDPCLFRAALLRVPAEERDAWLDSVLGLGDLPADGPALPRGCVPYLPSAVGTLLHVVERAPVRASDVFVDIGAGLGRAVVLVHLLTGAAAVGLEIQPELVRAARDLMKRLQLSRVSCIEGDGAKLAGVGDVGSVFFLYCPFSGDRLAQALADLERVARTRTIRVCAVDLPLPACPWLTLQESDPADGLAIYRSRG